MQHVLAEVVLVDDVLHVFVVLHGCAKVKVLDVKAGAPCSWHADCAVPDHFCCGQFCHSHGEFAWVFDEVAISCQHCACMLASVGIIKGACGQVLCWHRHEREAPQFHCGVVVSIYDELVSVEEAASIGIVCEHVSCIAEDGGGEE